MVSSIIGLQFTCFHFALYAMFKEWAKLNKQNSWQKTLSCFLNRYGVNNISLEYFITRFL